MSSYELNKIFAAVLTVSLVIMLTGFVSQKVMVSKELEKDAVEIDGAEEAGGHSSGTSGPKLPEPIMAMLAEADVERGAKISKACVQCHSFEKGGPLKQGPNLWNIVNKLKCETTGFAYSDALKALEGKWDYDSLNKFIAKPKKYAPGTKMNYVGVKKAKDRAALIAWLRTMAPSPAPLPTAAQIEAEEAAFAPPEEEAHGEAKEGAAETAETPAH